MAKDKNWTLFKTGDYSAFERMYREHISELYDYGKKFSSDSSIVEDCIQDMFIDFWEKREKLNDVENVKAYLFVSFKRRLLRELKKNNVVKPIEESDDFKTELSIEEILEKTEMDSQNIKKLQTAFQKLNKKQQHILYLKFHQGFNNKEIAEILQINYQSTRNALTRALSKLKTHFLVLIISFGTDLLLKIM